MLRTLAVLFSVLFEPKIIPDVIDSVLVIVCGVAKEGIHLL